MDGSASDCVVSLGFVNFDKVLQWFYEDPQVSNGYGKFPSPTVLQCKGTDGVDECIAALKEKNDAISVVGGADSVAPVNKVSPAPKCAESLYTGDSDDGADLDGSESDHSGWLCFLFVF